MNRLSDDDKKQIIGTINILVNLAKVDNEVHGKELLYLLHVGKNLGLSEQTTRDMLNRPKVDIQVPSSEERRMTMLYHLLFMMKMDGVISEDERKLIVHYGFLLGFNELMVMEMIDAIKDHIYTFLPEDELINIVKKHLN
jgi:hypothetical protein